MAALRGHDVTLLEAADRARRPHEGCALAPHQADLAHLLGFLVPEAKRAGGKFEMGSTRRARRTFGPQAGCRSSSPPAPWPSTPLSPGDGSVPVLTGDGAIDLTGCRDRRVVLMDEDGYAWSARRSRGTTRRQGARDGRHALLRGVARIADGLTDRDVAGGRPAGGDHRGRHGTCASVSNGAVALRHYNGGVHGGNVADVAAIVWVGAAQANSALAENSGRRVRQIPPTIVGDAFSPPPRPCARRGTCGGDGGC